MYVFYFYYLTYLHTEKTLKIKDFFRSYWDFYYYLLGLLLLFIGTFITVDNYLLGLVLLYWDLTLISKS